MRIPGEVTHTYAVLKISAIAFAEIERLLKAAGYEHAFHEDAMYGTVIDMHGIAVAKEAA
jgi:hypothetical protein